MSQATLTEEGGKALSHERQGCLVGTHILTLPAAIQAKQEGLGRDEFLQQQIEEGLKLGIEQLELHFESEFLYPGITRPAVKRLTEYRREFAFSAHLPFRYVDISCPIPRIRAASVKTILDSIVLAADLSPLGYVIHLVGDVFPCYKSRLDPMIGEALIYAERSLRQIVELVEPSRILVENLPSIDFEYFLSLVQSLGLSICQDVGHLVLQGKDYLEFVKIYAPLIKEIHLHDTERRYFSNSAQLLTDHQPIGEGILDFGFFFATLADVNYSGSLVLEVEDNNLLSESVQRVRELMHLYLSVSAGGIFVPGKI